MSTVRRLTARLLGCDPAAEPLPECERVCVACVYRVCIGLCVFVSPGPVRVPSNNKFTRVAVRCANIIIFRESARVCVV